MTTTDIDRTERLHGLDALRGAALLLGVVLHGAMSFFPTQIWIVADDQRSVWASGLFFVIHIFRMTTFFLIAGLFAHMMLERRGTFGFIKDRVIRIGGPLATFWTPVLAAIIAGLVWMAAIRNGGTIPTDGTLPDRTMLSYQFDSGSGNFIIQSRELAGLVAPTPPIRSATTSPFATATSTLHGSTSRTR